MIPHDFLTTIAQDYHLSGGEEEVLVLAMEGKPTAAIAQDLGISGDAVRKRLSEVYQKFRITGRGPVKLTRLQQLLVSQYQNQYQEQFAQNQAGQNQSGQNQAGQNQAGQNQSDQQSSLGQMSAQSQSSSESAASAISASEDRGRSPVVHWGEAPDVSVFYGRDTELAQLQKSILQDHCRLVTVLGMAGMGKTALVVKLAQSLQPHFESMVWLSLRHAPPLEDLLCQMMAILLNQTPPRDEQNASTDMLESLISPVIHHLRNHRCLLVLDGAESMLQSSRLAGVYKEGYEDYQEFFTRLGQENHQSCVVVTSREKLAEISLLEGETAPVRSFILNGLTEDEAKQLLVEKGLTGDTKKWTDLIRGYRGNPFMLKMVATTIREVFDGNVTTFLKTTLFTHDINDYIEDILDRISDMEEEIMFQIALKQQPLSMDELMDALPDSSPQDLIQALQSLKQRSLLETSEGRFHLPPAVMTVISEELKSEKVAG